MDVPLLKHFHRCVQFGCHLLESRRGGFPQQPGSPMTLWRWTPGLGVSSFPKCSCPPAHSPSPQAPQARALRSLSRDLWLESQRGFWAKGTGAGPVPLLLLSHGSGPQDTGSCVHRLGRAGSTSRACLEEECACRGLPSWSVATLVREPGLDEMPLVLPCPEPSCPRIPDSHHHQQEGSGASKKRVHTSSGLWTRFISV